MSPEDGAAAEEPIFLGFISLPIEVQQACIDALAAEGDDDHDADVE
jgi:hypothetical protein